MMKSQRLDDALQALAEVAGREQRLARLQQRRQAADFFV